MTDSAVTQLRELIRASRLSQADFARLILMRDARTVRRWLAGDSPIPQPVRAWMARKHKTGSTTDTP